MDTKELDKMRREDIDYFAKKYAELFGEYFKKNTNKEKEEFEQEIKRELLEKAPKYVIVNNQQEMGSTNAAESRKNEIVFLNNNVNDKVTRIHELFHSYNRFVSKEDNDLEVNRLNFHFLNEGITEMYAQKMCEKREPQFANPYPNEVCVAKYITSIIGEKDMTIATHGNPNLLYEATDRMLKTKGFLTNLENMQKISQGIIQNSMGKSSDGYGKISDAKKIMANLALDTKLIIEDIEPIIINAVKNANDPDLYKRFEKVYNELSEKELKNKKDESLPKYEQNKETLADIQQKILKKEIDKINELKNPTSKQIMRLEMSKLLYDRIDYQKYFLNHDFPEYETYSYTDEDREYSNNYKSSLDGEKKRLGRNIAGITSVIDNASYLLNRENIDNVSKLTFNFQGVYKYKLECLAEKLNIEQQKEILEPKFSEVIYELYFKEKFPNEDKSKYEETMEELRNNLEKRNQELIEKYETLENEKFDNNEQLLNKIVPNEVEEKPIIEKKEQNKTIEDDNRVKINKPEHVEHTISNMQEQTNQELKQNSEENLWMGRFKNWYTAIDRTPENIKIKLVKMKEDIIKSIKEIVMGKDKEKNEEISR